MSVTNCQLTLRNVSKEQRLSFVLSTFRVGCNISLMISRLLLNIFAVCETQFTFTSLVTVCSHPSQWNLAQHEISCYELRFHIPCSLFLRRVCRKLKVLRNLLQYAAVIVLLFLTSGKVGCSLQGRSAFGGCSGQTPEQGSVGHS